MNFCYYISLVSLLVIQFLPYFRYMCMLPINHSAMAELQNESLNKIFDCTIMMLEHPFTTVLCDNRYTHCCW